jgi:DNA polymerase-1
MILQVHDELVFEVPEAEKAAVEPLVREAMESAAQLAVPLLVRLGFGPNWADAK